MASAFVEGTAFTKLEFSDCSFSALESVECAAIMANGFNKNTSVSNIIKVVSVVSLRSPFDDALNDALTVALPSNSTLQVLSFEARSWLHPVARVEWSPIFWGLNENTGLKTLSVDLYNSMDESLCTAIKRGLEKNATLEHLKCRHVPLHDESAALWCRALSFLQTNKALKSLDVHVQDGVAESCLSAFRIDIAAMLQKNTSLESLSISCGDRSKIKAEEYIALVTALQHNTTLKSLQFRGHLPTWLNDDEEKQMAKFLKNNYGLERFPLSCKMDPAGDVCAILKLNQAGRRYLIEDGSSMSKGVEALSKVYNDVNCLFLHLSENPRLCDRSAVEMITADESNDAPTSPTASSGGGKREQASVPKGGKESRRRLA